MDGRDLDIEFGDVEVGRHVAVEGLGGGDGEVEFGAEGELEAHVDVAGG